jgi:saccharopine dehydrogenase-like NADP-dependent oxidoreductase
MKIVIVGAGGVGSSMAQLLASRPFPEKVLLVDAALDSASRAAATTNDTRFSALGINAAETETLTRVLLDFKADVVVNACDPRLNPSIFAAARRAGCSYVDMAMDLSIPHPYEPYSKVGKHLGYDQLASSESWASAGLMALVGMGVEPGLSDVFARYASDHLFDEIYEIGVRDGSNLSIDGFDFAPTFSIWTTIEECLNPPIVWDSKSGLYTTECFSEPEIFHFPAGIGPIECVNVEHEEVILIPNKIDCQRVTFKYGLGRDFIDWLKTFAYLGLDSKELIDVAGVSVAPRDVLASVLPNPSKLGHLMHGKTCAGTWVKGLSEGAVREVYLYHVADNDVTMREWGSQAVLWQTAVCPVIALDLMASGTWRDVGVFGPEHFDAVPFLNKLGEYGTHHGVLDLGPGLWPSPRQTGQPGWDRPVRRMPVF